MRDFLEFTGFILGVLVAVIGVIGVIVGLASWGDSTVCRSKANRMGFAHEWGLFEGCMIEYLPGQWIDLDKYSGVELPEGRKQ